MICHRSLPLGVGLTLQTLPRSDEQPPAGPPAEPLQIAAIVAMSNSAQDLETVVAREEEPEPGPAAKQQAAPCLAHIHPGDAEFALAVAQVRRKASIGACSWTDS